MKFNPPLTVLFLVAIALSIIGVSNRITDCAYSPSGHLRWNAVNEWFVQPDYTWDRNRSDTPACDVWVEIQPVLPVGTIQLESQTDALGPVVARILPDGTGFVAVFKPFLKDRRDAQDAEGFAERSRFRKHSRVFDIDQNRPLRTQVEKLLAPMRNFRGQLPFDNVENLDLSEFDRKMLQLDDKRLINWQCRRAPRMSPWVGSSIVFGSSNEGGYPRYLVETECDDVAYHAMVSRRSKALTLLIEAAGATKFIANETVEKYPECRTGKMICFELLE